MKSIIFSVVFFLLLSATTQAQTKVQRNVNQFADVTFGIGSSQFTGSASYVRNWKLGKRKRLEAGFGARFTSYFGSNLYYRTAPAILTSGKTGPGVFFADDILPNIDSLLFPKSQVNMFNLTLNLGYNITKKISAGLNIDLIGFSFGKKQNGIYYANNFATGVPVTAKPTNVNLFLISDNDKGSLNSEFFAKYKWNDSWSVKLAFQFLFAEYTTNGKVQTTPGGDTNDRFRKKMSGVAVGIAYSFKSYKKEKL
ncbi:MAG: hypothetical protein WAT20_08895 [Ferruginibacter sp.]